MPFFFDLFDHAPLDTFHDTAAASSSHHAVDTAFVSHPHGWSPHHHSAATHFGFDDKTPLAYIASLTSSGKVVMVPLHENVDSSELLTSDSAANYRAFKPGALMQSTDHVDGITSKACGIVFIRAQDGEPAFDMGDPKDIPTASQASELMKHVTVSGHENCDQWITNLDANTSPGDRAHFDKGLVTQSVAQKLIQEGRNIGEQYSAAGDLSDYGVTSPTPDGGVQMAAWHRYIQAAVVEVKRHTIHDTYKDSPGGYGNNDDF